MFTDLVGSTELAARLGPVAAEGVRSVHFGLFGANLGGVRWQRGRLDEILPVIAQAAADNPGLPGFQAAYAMMLCECGRSDEARPLFEVARRADFHHAAYDWTWLTTTTVWADTAA